MCDGAGEVVAAGPGRDAIQGRRPHRQHVLPDLDRWTDSAGRVEEFARRPTRRRAGGVHRVAAERRDPHSRPPELRGSGDAALCGADGVERADRDRRHQVRRNRRDPRHRRRIVFRHSLRQDARGLRFPHIEQRRQARARQGARRRLADQLQIGCRTGTRRCSSVPTASASTMSSRSAAPTRSRSR